MKLFSRLIDKVVKSHHAGSCRPAWAAEVSAVSQPILLFSERSQFNAYGSDQQESPPNGTDSSDALRPGNGVNQPVCGANNAVPSPMPVLTGADVVSFWGTRSAITTEFVLPSEAALRIVAQGGPIEIGVGREDGTFLDDTASAEAIVLVFGLMVNGHSDERNVRFGDQCRDRGQMGCERRLPAFITHFQSGHDAS
jgi:hypothetical protein